MPAVTQRIESYLGGVSKQSDVKKSDGQVTDALNAYPDPTFGLVKRPGLNFTKVLGTTFSNAKWFFIQRDDQEQYVGCISGNEIKVWNKDGTAGTVTYPKYVSTIAVTANGTGSGTNGTLLNVATTGGTGSGLTVDLTISGGVVTAITPFKLGEVYVTGDVITIASSAAGTSANVTGTITTTTSQTYLTGTKPIHYDVLTVQDTSIITNKNVTVAKQADRNYTKNK